MREITDRINKVVVEEGGKPMEFPDGTLYDIGLDSLSCTMVLLQLDIEFDHSTELWADKTVSEMADDVVRW